MSMLTAHIALQSPALMYGASKPMEKRPNFLNSTWQVIVDPAVSPSVRYSLAGADAVSVTQPSQ